MGTTIDASTTVAYSGTHKIPIGDGSGIPRNNLASALVAAAVAAGPQTTADLPDSTDKRYVTDAEEAVIDNTSGINTGDQVLLFSQTIAVSDETTDLTTGTAKVTFRMPFAITLTGVRASVTTAPTGGTLLTVDINQGGSSILSTVLTFDDSEKTTTTAATPAVISTSALTDDAEMTIDIDAVGSTIAGDGLKVTLIGHY